MAIKIIGSGKRLAATANDVVYTPPGDVISATIASGTVENIVNVGAKLWIRIGGRNTWIINGKDIPVIGSPLVLPSITLNPGEWLEAWSDTVNALDISLTIGEQR
jgi:hypothetical protein